MGLLNDIIYPFTNDYLLLKSVEASHGTGAGVGLYTRQVVGFISTRVNEIFSIHFRHSSQGVSKLLLPFPLHAGYSVKLKKV